MTFEVDEIALSQTPAEALQSVAKLKDGGLGILKIASGSVKGSLSIRNGVIIAAYLNDFSARGLEALKRLLSLQDGAYQFIPDRLDDATAEFKISVSELLKHDLAIEKCLPSDEAAQLSNLLQKAKYESENAIVQTGEGSSETMEIPESVYENFMELINSQKPAAGKPGAEAVVEPPLVMPDVDDTSTQQFDERLFAHFAETGETAGFEKLAAVLTGNKEELKPATESSEPQSKALPDLSSWVSKPDDNSPSKAQASMESADDREIFDAAPPRDEPIYINIAHTQKLSEIKEKHSVEMINPAALDKVFAQSEVEQSAKRTSTNANPSAPEMPDSMSAALSAIPTPKVNSVSPSGIDSPVAKDPSVSQRQATLSPAPSMQSVRTDSVSGDDGLAISRHRMTAAVSKHPSLWDRATGLFSGGKSDSYDGSNGRHIGTILGVIVLVGICLAYVYVPSHMKANAERSDSQEIAKEQVQSIVNAGIERAIPYPAE